MSDKEVESWLSDQANFIREKIGNVSTGLTLKNNNSIFNLSSRFQRQLNGRLKDFGLEVDGRERVLDESSRIDLVKQIVDYGKKHAEKVHLGSFSFHLNFGGCVDLNDCKETSVTDGRSHNSQPHIKGGSRPKKPGRYEPGF